MLTGRICDDVCRQAQCIPSRRPRYWVLQCRFPSTFLAFQSLRRWERSMNNPFHPGLMVHCLPVTAYGTRQFYSHRRGERAIFSGQESKVCPLCWMCRCCRCSRRISLQSRSMEQSDVRLWFPWRVSSAVPMDRRRARPRCRQ